MLDPTEVERFRSVIAQRFGLQYENGRLDYLSEVLKQRMDATGCPRLDAYVERLGPSATRSTELRALAEQLTVNETFFFRNADNFQALTGHVLVERIAERAQQKRLRVLSAGCASGDEAYSLAIVIREALPDLARWDVTITGVDVNPAMLDKAARARYSAWALRATPEDVRRRYFRQEGRDFVLDPEIRKMVTFEEQNLVEPDSFFWRPSTYDLVLCRNVIMYFTPATMREVVRCIGQSLVPGGYLFLGHAETLRGLSQDFHLCHTHNTFYYQKREGGLAPSTTVSLTNTSNDPVADSLPVVVETSTSWVEAIQGASERITTLANHRQRKHADPTPTDDTPGVSVASRWDPSLVLETMRQERFDDALELLSTLPPDPHWAAEGLLLRAVLLTNSGRTQEAEDTCARLLALDELNAGAHYAMALCREHTGDAAGAIEHDQTAVYLDTSFAMPHLHLGLMARRSGDSATAERELSQALVLLAREDTSRLLLFGGGFSRDALMALCRTERNAAGGHR